MANLKPLDEKLLDLLASYGLSTAEIAAVLGCSSDTLERNYKEEMKTGKLKAKAGLRRKQFELAMQGNVTMLIWLGKNMLGQSDKLETHANDKPFTPVDREVLIERIANDKPASGTVQ
jgi:hypothetical protein